MSNRLIINPGTPQAWEIQLKPGVNRIGRGEDNDFVINHQSVSTHHCELIVADSTVTLRDLGSTNGTFVERVPVTEIQLHTGHHVQFGSVGLVFESVGLPPLPDAVNLPGDGAHIMVANPTPAPPPPPPHPLGLRINRPEAGGAQAAAAPSLPPPPIPIRNFTATTTATAGSGLSNRQSLIRGSIGAVGGGLIGLFAWYFITKFTGYSFKLVALGVGALTGGAARMLAKDGSLGLGMVCGICALLAIVLGDYYGVRALVMKEVAQFASIADGLYAAQLEYAKGAVAAKTPEEIRKFIAEQEEKTPAEVTEEEMADFKKELPKLQELSEGKVSKEQFRQQLDSAVADNFSYKEYFFQGDVKGSIFQILFICLGVATAWKIGAGDAAAD